MVISGGYFENTAATKFTQTRRRKVTVPEKDYGKATIYGRDLRKSNNAGVWGLMFCRRAPESPNNTEIYGVFFIIYVLLLQY